MSFSSAGYQLLPVLPELVLAVGAMALLMLGAYRGEGTTRLVTTLAVVLLVVTGALELMLPAGKLTTFGGSFIVDDFARFLKILAIIGSAVTLILSTEFLSDPSRRIFEYSILVLLSTLGMMVLISAADLIMLYLGLELMSLALYVVAASNRDNAKSTEAGLKYFVLGALSSGMLLYGASLIYGFTGTVEFAGSQPPPRSAAPAAPASCSASCFCWPGSASRSRPCRSICGRPTSMRARRRRSRPSLPRRRRLPRSPCSPA